MYAAVYIPQLKLTLVVEVVKPGKAVIGPLVTARYVQGTV
jgi:hypothetical protein